MGILDKIGLAKLSRGLLKTREGLIGKVARLVSLRPAIDDEALDSLEEILIGADVGTETAGSIIEGVRRRIKDGAQVPGASLVELLQREIEDEFLNHAPAGELARQREADPRPKVVLVVGINGVGKTTTVGKLAHLFAAEGKRVVIGAADTFRAAANEQLAIWAQRAGAELIRQDQGSDPAAVAFDTVRAAASRNADIAIIDTAGRLHTKVNLMEELKKIRRVIQKVLPDAPHEVLLVIDASTGQNGLQQARRFDASVGVTGLVLTKLDGTAKGGVVLGIMREMNVPVKYIGVGEQIDDLQPFDRQEFLQALFSS